MIRSNMMEWHNVEQDVKPKHGVPAGCVATTCGMTLRGGETAESPTDDSPLCPQCFPPPEDTKPAGKASMKEEGSEDVKEVKTKSGKGAKSKDDGGDR